MPRPNRAPKDPDDYAVLGRALRELRNLATLTQEELAARSGVGATYVSQVEHGHRGIRWHTLLKFLHALGADLHQLADAIDRQGRQHSE